MCGSDWVFEECPVTEPGMIVNSGSLLVRMLICTLLSGKVLEFASDVLGSICLILFFFSAEKQAFCSFSTHPWFSRCGC